MHTALGEDNGHEAQLNSVVELMLDLTESSVAFCWELGAGQICLMHLHAMHSKQRVVDVSDGAVVTVPTAHASCKLHTACAHVLVSKTTVTGKDYTALHHESDWPLYPHVMTMYLPSD